MELCWVSNSSKFITSLDSQSPDITFITDQVHWKFMQTCWQTGRLSSWTNPLEHHFDDDCNQSIRTSNSLRLFFLVSCGVSISSLVTDIKTDIKDCILVTIAEIWMKKGNRQNTEVFRIFTKKLAYENCCAMIYYNLCYGLSQQQSIHQLISTFGD